MYMSNCDTAMRICVLLSKHLVYISKVSNIMKNIVEVVDIISDSITSDKDIGEEETIIVEGITVNIGKTPSTEISDYVLKTNAGGVELPDVIDLLGSDVPSCIQKKVFL